MSIKAIIIRSMSGYIFLIPLILMYIFCLKKKKSRVTTSHIITLFVFSYYIIGVLTMTGIGKLHPFSPRLVLIPSEDLIKVTIDTILNVILFMPLGFFLPLLYKEYKTIGKVTLAGFILSLSIELVQLFGRGATDINDLITNVIGTIIGYAIYKLFHKLIGDKTDTISQHTINGNIELIILIVVAFIIMTTIQAWVISTFFNLG